MPNRSVTVCEIDKLRQDQQFSAQLLGSELQFRTTWGLFSPRGIDEGSALLLDHLEPDGHGNTLDIGCGYGPLGLSIARCSEGRVDMVDKDFLAVEYANRNAEINGLSNASAFLSNGCSHVPNDNRYSLVVSNLPAKVGNELLYVMFFDAMQRLQPEGRIVVVTINGLRQFVKRAFNEVFGNYKKVKQGKNYTISLAYRE